MKSLCIGPKLFFKKKEVVVVFLEVSWERQVYKVWSEVVACIDLV